MLRYKKLIPFFIALSLIVAFLSGCITPEGTELLKAFKNVGNINSMESDSKLKINVDAQGLAPSDAEIFSEIKDLVNNLQLNYFTKFNQNQDRTIVKSYSQLSANVDIYPIKADIWLNQDLTGKTPVVKEIIKSPELFSALFPPKFADKYMVADLEQMKKNPETKEFLSTIDLTKMTQSNSELKEKVVEFVDEFVDQYDIGFNPITDKGTATVNSTNAHLYQLKLSDAEIKTIIRKTVTDYSKNKPAMDFIKDYMLLSVESSGLTGTELDKAKKEIEDFFANISSDATQTEINSALDKIDNITLLGEKGIDITYAINDAGYIINEKGTLQVVLDLKKLSQLTNELSGTTDTAEELTGIYTIELSYETNNNKINSVGTITFPTLTSKNSFTIEQLLAELNPKPKPVVRKAPPTILLYKKQSAKLYKKVYYVKVKDAVAKLKGKYTYSEGKATIKINGKTIKMQLGRKYIMFNGKKVNLKIKNGIIVKRKLYIPLKVYTMAGVKIKLK